MIKVIVTRGGQVLDQIKFDGVNLLHYDGGIACIHRDVMQSCQRDDVWSRVAHAAAVIARRGSLLDALEASLRPHAEAPEHSETEAEVAGGDFYRLERDRDESDDDYRERCRLLGCDKDGLIRLPRWTP
jgi:hypothetical protein